MVSKSPGQVAYRMAALFAIGSAVLIFLGQMLSDYQLFGLGLITLATAGGWVVKAWRVSRER